MAFISDHLGTQQPVGIRVVAELFADSREDAETALLIGATSISTTLGFHTSSVIEIPTLERVAAVGMEDGLIVQSQYRYHGAETSRVRLSDSRVARLSERMLNMETLIRDRVGLSQRWYRVSISSEDPIDAFLAAWIGWEAIAANLNDAVHPTGPNPTCGVCENVATTGRGRSEAAYDHISSQVATSLRDSWKHDELELLRHGIAHGNGTAEDSREKVAPVVKDFQLVLAQGVLALLKRTPGLDGDEWSGRWSAALPRNMTTRPDVRYWARFDREILEYKPFYGGWIGFEDERINEHSHLSDDGFYTYRTGISTVWHGSEVTREIVERGCERYIRFGVDWRSVETGTDVDQCDEVAWHGETVPDSWRRVVEEAES